MESTPLLADPPIDDDSYQQTDHVLPSPQQTHLVYAGACFSLTVSRAFEVLLPLTVIIVFGENMYPVTVLSLCLAFFAAPLEKLLLRSTTEMDRFTLMATSTLIHRLLPFLGCLSTIYYLTNAQFFTAHFLVYRWCTLLICVSSLLAERVFSRLQLSALQDDWVYILTGDQASVYNQIRATFLSISRFASLGSCFVVGLTLRLFDVLNVLRLACLVLGLSFFLEAFVLVQIYLSCYALSLPPQSQQIHTVSSSYHSWTQIWRFIQRKPRISLVSITKILLRFSVLTAGPQFGLFLFDNYINILFIALLPALQKLAVRTPLTDAPGLALIAVLSAAGSLIALYFNLLYSLGILAILNRAAVHKLDVVTRVFAGQEVTGEDQRITLATFESRCKYASEGLVQLLTIIWSSTDKFPWPASISAITTLVGSVIISSALLWP